MDCRERPAADPTPVLSAEIFSIPLEDSKYALYAPLRRSAFVANAQVVDFIEQLRQGNFDAAADPDGSLRKLLRALGMVDAGPEHPPAAACHGDPQPTSVTLLLTTACNLRCTYCYASAGGLFWHEPPANSAVGRPDNAAC